MNKLFLLAFLAALSVRTGVASANPTYTLWAANGAGCVPGDPAIQGNLYFITAGSVNYNSTASGLVTLYCAIKPWNPIFIPNKLTMTYTDQSTVANNYVKAQVIRMSRTDGSISTLGASYGLATSDGYESFHEQFGGFDGSAFDFVNYYYYLRVDLDRTSTTPWETFYGATIEGM